MGGSSVVDDRNFMSHTINLLLLGKTGHGKSSTGNSILGRNAFVPKPSFFGVTSTCELQSTKLKDGRVLNVIDTPGGLFDSSDGAESSCKQIVECVDLAKDGMHAVLVVLSVRSHRYNEIKAAIKNLMNLFGEKILKYMILIFTGGDELESLGPSLEDFIEFILAFRHRIILFDNKTCDEGKRAEQLEFLMQLVHNVLADNSGKPYSDFHFDEQKEGALMLHQKQKEIESMKGCSERQQTALKEEIYESYDDQIARIIEMVEQKLKQTVEGLEKRLGKSEKETRKLRESLEEAKRDSEEFRKLAESNNGCAIL